MAKCRPGYQMTLSWVPAEDGHVPKNAIGVDGGIYVCRAEHEGKIIPGSLVPADKAATICLDDVVYKKRTYEVLCNSSFGCRCAYYWISDERGYTPKNALVAGSHQPGCYALIARAKINGKMAIGMLTEFCSEACFVVNDAIETSEYYEILVWEKKPA
ncbi:unnamed protein product [Dicrocoelium dendriticum]|nr:unnamed protein product [Dicrocoelium dendriticum]